VAYLHELGIVHGDLKGVSPTFSTRLSPHRQVKQANILVDNTCTARVADFGLMAMTDLSAVFFSETDISSGGTFCWMSPELLDSSRFGSNGRPTHESDCYALGMVIYEVSWSSSSRPPLINSPQVLTGLRPFYHLHAYLPVLAVVRGERPGKPLGAESLGFSDALWELLQSCWSDSSSARPTTQRLLDSLSHASRTWVPHSVYPAIRVDIDSDSSGSL